VLSSAISSVNTSRSVNTRSTVYQPPVNHGLDFLYRDAHLLVLEKPSGLLSVPGRGPAHRDSLSARVQNEFPDALIVHRLDMDTSGILVMARNKEVQRNLCRLFQERRVMKRYIAVVEGHMLHDQGEVDLPLLMDWPNRPRQIVDHARGKPSLSRYRVLDRDARSHTTRVELMPTTGRTHQLRVHMSMLGHAILGDNLYAGTSTQAKSDRLLLHAGELGFAHPASGEFMQFESQTPF
jgi:tRNA pseudouridine32 synthase/23S rRNA pseudouridine746 synthase